MAVTLEELVARLRLDSSGFDQGMSRVSGTATRSGGVLSGVGRKIATGLGLSIGGIITKGVQLEATFSKTMRQVAIATDAPTTALSKLATKMGAETVFSANDAASAMLELAKGGMTSAQIQGGALAATMKLASAGGVDLAAAATYVSNGLQTYGLKAGKANDVTVALAGAANASSASVESLGQALQQGALAAKNAGLSLQQTTGVLSLFDAKGLKGSDAGTSLKTMLNSLTPATKRQQEAMKKLNLDFTDSNGHFLSIDKVAQQLHDRLGKLTEVQRAQALETIFGSDGMRAATILMNGGAKAVDRYVKASRDQATTSKLANAGMQGTSGALERLKGSAETAALQLGRDLAPTIQRVSNFLSSRAIPSVQRFLEQMQSGKGAGGEFAHFLGDIVSVGKGVVSFFNSIPGPVKRFGAEALIAGIAVSKLNSLLGGGIGSVGRWVGALSNAETRTGAVASASNKLGGVLRNVATTGGLLLLADGAHRASKGLGTLETAAGGALTGAGLGAFAGPPGAAIGAAVGGLGGLIVGLARGTKRAGVAAGDSISEWRSLAQTLDDVTGATTAATRSMVFSDLQKSHTIQTTRQLGLADRLVVDAVVNGGAARDKVTAALNRQLDAQRKVIAAAEQENRTINVDKNAGPAQRAQRAANAAKIAEAQARINNLKAIGRELGAVDRATAAKRHEIAVTREFSKQINTLPRAVQTALRAKVLNKRDVIDLIAKYNLARKDVRTLIKENGGRPTKAMIDRLIESARTLQHTDPNVRVTATDNASRKLNAVRQLIRSLDGSHANTYVTHHITTVRGLLQKRARGGPVTDDDVYLVGEDGPELFVSDRAGQIVPNPRTAAARAHRPVPRVPTPRASALIPAAVIRGLSDTSVKKVTSAISKLNDSLRKRGAIGHAIVTASRDEERQLISTARRYENMTVKVAAAEKSYNALVKAKATLAKSVTDEARGTIIGSGAVSSQSIELAQRNRLTKLNEFADNFAKLQEEGASNTILRQLADAGVDQGSATAKALIAGGPDAVKRITDLQNQLDRAATKLGTRTSSVLYDAGIHSAAGLVNGLKAQQRSIALAADRLAAALVHAVRHRLGIHSPSRVFDELGQNIGRGLQQGVERSRAGVQRSVERLVDVPRVGVQDVTGTGGPRAYVPVQINAPQLRSDEQIAKLIGGRVAAAVAGRGVVLVTPDAGD